MGWVEVGIAIFMLVIKYGPTVVKLAMGIYKTIEDYSKRKREDPEFHAFDGEKATSKDKRMRFDTLLKVRASVLKKARELSQPEIDEIRETVWRAHNRRKKPGKAK